MKKKQGFEELEGWYAHVLARIASGDGYSAELVRSGKVGAAKKVGEESAEVIIAALAESPERLREEAADLVFHLMVLLRVSGVEPGEVIEVLGRRRRQSSFYS